MRIYLKNWKQIDVKEFPKNQTYSLSVPFQINEFGKMHDWYLAIDVSEKALKLNPEIEELNKPVYPKSRPLDSILRTWHKHFSTFKNKECEVWEWYKPTNDDIKEGGGHIYSGITYGHKDSFRGKLQRFYLDNIMPYGTKFLNLHTYTIVGMILRPLYGFKVRTKPKDKQIRFNAHFLRNLYASKIEFITSFEMDKQAQETLCLIMLTTVLEIMPNQAQQIIDFYYNLVDLEPKVRYHEYSQALPELIGEGKWWIPLKITTS